MSIEAANQAASTNRLYEEAKAAETNPEIVREVLAKEVREALNKDARYIAEAMVSLARCIPSAEVVNGFSRRLVGIEDAIDRLTSELRTHRRAKEGCSVSYLRLSKRAYNVLASAIYRRPLTKISYQEYANVADADVESLTTRLTLHHIRARPGCGEITLEEIRVAFESVDFPIPIGSVAEVIQSEFDSSVSTAPK
jgi:hypothetical protein